MATRVSFFIDYAESGLWGAWRITDDGPAGPSGMASSPSNMDADLLSLIRWAEEQSGSDEYVDLCDAAGVLLGLDMEGMRV